MNNVILRIGKMLMILPILLFVESAISQDAQFSQFYSTPMYLNPALTGSHSGTYRLMSSYRSQWAGALEKPFTTFTASGDLKLTIRNKRGSLNGGNDKAAVGIQFFSDRVGLYDYNTNHLAFSGAYHKLLSGISNSYLSAGFQFGLGQKGVNYEDLTFQDQFNGVDQFNGPTSELLPANSLGYGDFSLGLHFASQPELDKGLYFGVAYQHLNEPNISFFNRDLNLQEDYLPFKLNAKLTVHGGLSLKRSELLSIQPRAVFIKQANASTAILGTNLKYNFLEKDRVSFHLGGWIRSSSNLTTFQPTDLILTVGFEQRGLLMGFSYDYHLRQLSGTALGQGIFEFSISYIGEHDNEDRICPEF